MSAEIAVTVAREADSLRGQMEQSRAAVADVLRSGLEEVLGLLGPLRESVGALQVRGEEAFLCAVRREEGRGLSHDHVLPLCLYRVLFFRIKWSFRPAPLRSS